MKEVTVQIKIRCEDSMDPDQAGSAIESGLNLLDIRSDSELDQIVSWNIQKIGPVVNLK